MFMADQHIHSLISSDARDSMEDMAAAALSRGVRWLCFTDHFDMDWYETGLPQTDVHLNWPRCRADFARAREKSDPAVELRLGLELGEIDHDPERAARLAGEAGVDFVIGSTHNLKNTPDFCRLRYESEAACRRLNLLYLQELIATARTGLFDVIGHIGYTRRYMSRQGFESRISVAEHGDLLRELFSILIPAGRGIELNCSPLRADPGGEAFPSRDVLALYREMGGEIVTLGSDAHCCADAGVGLASGREILLDAGFRYLAVYTRRKPAFIPLD